MRQSVCHRLGEYGRERSLLVLTPVALLHSDWVRRRCLEPIGRAENNRFDIRDVRYATSIHVMFEIELLEPGSNSVEPGSDHSDDHRRDLDNMAQLHGQFRQNQLFLYAESDTQSLVDQGRCSN